MFKIVFKGLEEIGMSGPLTGEGSIEFVKTGEKIQLSKDCGGPAVWSPDSEYVAVPVWPHRGNAVIAIFDTKNKQFRLDTKPRGLLRMKSFDGKRVEGTEHARDGEIPFQFELASLFPA